MKKSTLLAWAIVLLCLVMSCTSCTSGSNYPEPKLVQAKVHQAWGNDRNLKDVRFINALYSVGDTIEIPVHGHAGATDEYIVDQVFPIQTQGGSR